MIRQKLVCVFAFLSLLGPSISVNGQDRVPTPSEKQRLAATAKLATTYRDQFTAAKTKEEKSQLAREILTGALASDDSTERYAMLRLSLDISRGAQDFGSAIAAVKTMGQFYEIDPKVIQSQLNALRKSKSVVEADSNKGSNKGTKSSHPSSGSTKLLNIYAPWPEGQDQIVYDLPSVFDDVIVGGEGRYLIFLIGIESKIVFFDVSKREVTHEMTVLEGDVKIAATSDSFYLAFPSSNEIQRWSLGTFDKVTTQKLPLQQPVELIAAGFASRGPIYAGASQGAGVFLDGKSMRPLNCQVNDQHYQREGELPGAQVASRIRASANGKAFSFVTAKGSPFGFRTLIYKGRTADMYYDHDTVGYIAPSHNGELMYTAKGVFTYQTKPYASNDELHAQSFHVPSLASGYSVSVARSDDRKAKHVARVNIHVRGQPEPVHTIAAAAIRPGRYGDFHDRELITLDRRVYLHTAAKMLITLPESNRSVVMHRVEGLDGSSSKPVSKSISVAATSISAEPDQAMARTGPVKVVVRENELSTMPKVDLSADDRENEPRMDPVAMRKLPENFPPIPTSPNPPQPFVGKSISGPAIIPESMNDLLENEYSPESFDKHVALLRLPEASLRRAAADKICGVAFDDKARVAHVARGLLLDPSPAVRQVALDAFVGHRYDDFADTALPELLLLLGTGDQDVQAAALKGIAKSGDNAGPAIPHLKWVIEGPDEAIVSRACETVEYLGDVAETLHPALIKLIDDKTRFHGSHQAAHAIGASGTEDSIAKVLTDQRIDSINGKHVGDLSSLMYGMRQRDSLSAKERQLLEKATKSRDKGTAKDAQETLDHLAK